MAKNLLGVIYKTRKLMCVLKLSSLYSNYLFLMAENLIRVIQGFPFENFGGGGDKIPPPLGQVGGGGGNIRRFLVGWESTILPI